MNEYENDQWLRGKLTELDDSFPDIMGDPEAIWQRINNKQKGSRQLRSLSIAASVSLFITVSVVLLKPSQETTEVVIKYRVEYSDSLAQSSENVSEENDIEAVRFIEEHCLAQNPACLAQPFKELKSELESLRLESAALDKKLSMFGRDPALVRAQITIENQKVLVIKELIQLIRS